MQEVSRWETKESGLSRTRSRFDSAVWLLRRREERYCVSGWFPEKHPGPGGFSGLRPPRIGQRSCGGNGNKTRYQYNSDPEANFDGLPAPKLI